MTSDPRVVGADTLSVDVTDGRSSFPRQLARTRRFTLGLPRAVVFAPGGDRLLFLRSAGGDDPVTGLWEAVRDDDGGLVERCLVDPRRLDAGDDEPPAEERARRERAREQASGIVAFATDRELSLVAFALGGRLFTHQVASDLTVEHPTAGPVFDPRPAPDGRRIAYVCGDGLHILELPGGPGQPGATRPLLVEDGVSWGRAEFVAAEEMRRERGYWWAPDSERIAVARVDGSAVGTWHIADPATPWTSAGAHRYPAAGTANAEVRLAVVALSDRRRVDVQWDREAAPYLTRVTWPDPLGQRDRLTVQVQSRDQRTATILAVDPSSGQTETVRTLTDPAWVELVVGSPAWCGASLVTVEDLEEHGNDGSRALVIDGQPASPPGLQVRSVVHTDDTGVLFVGADEDPTAIHAYRWQDGAVTCLTSDGVTQAAGAGGATMVLTAHPDRGLPTTEVRWAESAGGGGGTLQVLAEAPRLRISPRWLTLGERRLRAALLLPTDDDGASRLPVVLDPYGGPHAQRVLRSQVAMATSQWFADQGFAVLVVDGGGSPGRGPRFEREIHGDLASVPLADQLDALDAAAEIEPRLDLQRVGIRGWSFGGYLAALAALRAPERIRAAIAGAPVTDWRLYDTHYTERYLGTPQARPGSYEVSSLVDADAALGPAAEWREDSTPELLLIHGLADDNVVAAHSLRLSSALLAAGRPHRFLPLSGVTHMTPQEVITERLLELQVRFLREVLGGPRA